MCLGMFRSPKTPTPPPLPPAPPPPLPPAPPVPAPEPLLEEVDDENTTITKQESKKEKNPAAQGTGALRIPLKETLNLGTSLAGSLNIPK